MTRTHIIYSGRVQGVGFRYTVQSLAVKLNLTGWVKNLSDGRVEMVVDGPTQMVTTLGEHIESHFAGHIKLKEIDTLEITELFKNFQIAY